MELAEPQPSMDDSAPSRFEYQRLETPTSIRILALEPGTANEPLRGALQHSDLESERPIFEALSYVWGAVIYDCSFECPTGIVKITDSLEVALQRLRSPRKTKHIWADGICINQQDILERGSQVKLMGQIYSGAHSVKIWLGRAARRAFDFILASGSRWRKPNMDLSPLAELSKLEYFKRIWVRVRSRQGICYCPKSTKTTQFLRWKGTSAIP
jgi:hypothetical protein